MEGKSMNDYVEEDKTKNIQLLDRSVDYCSVTRYTDYIKWSLFTTKMKKGKISGKDNGQYKEDKSRERNVRGRKEI